MKPDAKSQLTKILGEYEEKLAAAERIDSANRAAHAAFPEQFVGLRTSVIAPTLQEISAMLTERGHQVEVREQEESSSAAGGVKSASVTLRLVPKPFTAKSTDSSPVTVEVSFSANRAARKVTVSSTNTMIGHGGRVGKRGEYDVDEVDSDVVATHVIQTLDEAFGGKK
jgi:hypothetical protein